jgi:hypothetical protein
MVKLPMRANFTGYQPIRVEYFERKFDAVNLLVNNQSQRVLPVNFTSCSKLYSITKTYDLQISKWVLLKQTIMLGILTDWLDQVKLLFCDKIFSYLRQFFRFFLCHAISATALFVQMFWHVHQRNFYNAVTFGSKECFSR